MRNGNLKKYLILYNFKIVKYPNLGVKSLNIINIKMGNT